MDTERLRCQRHSQRAHRWGADAWDEREAQEQDDLLIGHKEARM